MKKFLALTTMTILLTACGNETSSNSFNGTWEKVDAEEAGCRDSFTFKEGNKFEVQNSRLQGGKKLTGTYKNIEGNDYEFAYSEGTNTFNIEVNDDTMSVQMAGSDNVCEYNKVN